MNIYIYIYIYIYILTIYKQEENLFKIFFYLYYIGRLRYLSPTVLQHFLASELNPCNHLYMGKLLSCKSSSIYGRQRFVFSPIYENIVDNLLIL